MSELLGANVAGRPGPAPHAGPPPARELRSGTAQGQPGPAGRRADSM